MADRSLRGMRLGTQSLQSEVGVEFSPRQKSVYRAADGTEFEVVFAADAEVPQQWESPKTGQEGILVGSDGEPVILDTADVKVPRSHWDMLLERRTRAELEELLQEDEERTRHGGACGRQRRWNDRVSATSITTETRFASSAPTASETTLASAWGVSPPALACVA